MSLRKMKPNLLDQQLNLDFCAEQNPLSFKTIPPLQVETSSAYTDSRLPTVLKCAKSLWSQRLVPLESHVAVQSWGLYPSFDVSKGVPCQRNWIWFYPPAR